PGHDPRDRPSRRPGQRRRHLSEAARPAIYRIRCDGGPVSVRSMTGFARVRKTVTEGEIVLSLKSVNHRALDLHFHLPPELDPFEAAFRKTIKGKVARGHLQIHVSFSTSAQVADAALNKPLLAAYLAAFQAASAEFGLSGKP